MAEVIVKVIKNETGKPVKGKYISISRDELMASGTSGREMTNSDGLATLSMSDVGFKGTIYMDGKSVFKGKILAFNTLYI